MVGHVRPVGLVRHVRPNWCAAVVDWALAVYLAGWCGAPAFEVSGNLSQPKV